MPHREAISKINILREQSRTEKETQKNIELIKNSFEENEIDVQNIFTCIGTLRSNIEIKNDISSLRNDARYFVERLNEFVTY